MSEKIYMCPVCGFEGLKEPPYSDLGEPSYEICPCCGFEFGFDEKEAGNRYESYRSYWIGQGTKWFMPAAKPPGWNPTAQLNKLLKHRMKSSQ